MGQVVGDCGICLIREADLLDADFLGFLGFRMAWAIREKPL